MIRHLYVTFISQKQGAKNRISCLLPRITVGHFRRESSGLLVSHAWASLFIPSASQLGSRVGWPLCSSFCINGPPTIELGTIHGPLEISSHRLAEISRVGEKSPITITSSDGTIADSYAQLQDFVDCHIAV